MIEAHTLDAWTRAADRSSTAFGYLIVLGGFAAPLFLWLAGLGLVLSAERVLTRTGTPARGAEAVVRRGARDLHPRVPLPAPGVHRQPGQLARHALPRRHPERHGTGDRGGRGSCGASRRKSPGGCARLRARGRCHRDGDARSSGRPRWVERCCRSGSSGTSGPPATTRPSRCSPGPDSSLPAPPVASLLARTDDSRTERLAVARSEPRRGGCAGCWASTRRRCRPSTRVSSFWTSSPTYFAIRAGILMLALGVPFRGDAGRGLGSPAPRLFSSNLDATPYSSIGYTSSWSTATRPGSSTGACRSGGPAVAYLRVLCRDVRCHSAYATGS